MPAVAKTKDLEFLEAEKNWLLDQLESTLLLLEKKTLDFENEKKLIYEELDTKVEEYRSLSFGIIKTLAAAIDARDRYTRGHSERVSKYAQLIGAELGFSAEEQEHLLYAGLLHDVGKIGVADAILNKPGKLTPLERQMIQEHPVIGANIIETVHSLSCIVDDVRHHHERYDGRGYPVGLDSEDIPLRSRVLAVADTFDAMTTDRVYRRALSVDFTIEEIESLRGKQFDPVAVDAFLRAFEQGKVATIMQGRFKKHFGCL